MQIPLLLDDELLLCTPDFVVWGVSARPVLVQSQTFTSQQGSIAGQNLPLKGRAVSARIAGYCSKIPRAFPVIHLEELPKTPYSIPATDISTIIGSAVPEGPRDKEACVAAWIWCSPGPLKTSSFPSHSPRVLDNTPKSRMCFLRIQTGTWVLWCFLGCRRGQVQQLVLPFTRDVLAYHTPLHS